MLEKVLYELGFTVSTNYIREVPYIFGEESMLFTRYTKPWPNEHKRSFVDKLFNKNKRDKYNDDEYVEFSTNDKLYFNAIIWTKLDNPPIWYNSWNACNVGSVNYARTIPSPNLNSNQMKPYIIDVKSGYLSPIYKISLNKDEFYYKYQQLFREVKINEMI